MGWLKKIFQTGIVCSGCGVSDARAGTVKAGNEQVHLCSKCWGTLLANESELDRIVADHKKQRRLSENADNPFAGFGKCLNCASGITNETGVVVVFDRTVKAGERVANLYGDKGRPVAIILGFCAPCANKFVPGAHFQPGQHA